jgi:hypothetical protein
VFSLVVSTLNVQFEHITKESQSVQFGVFYTGFKVSDTKCTGFGITPEYRFYCSQKGAPRGFFVAPFLRYQNYSLKNEGSTYTDYESGSTITTEDAKATFSSFGGGAIIGFQGLIGETLSIEAFIGPSYNAGKVKVKDGADENEFSLGSFDGFGLRGGVTLGIAF